VSIEVRRSRKGRGVYATRTIAKGETIEVCHVLLVGNQPWASRHEHPYQEWAYEFFGKCAIALGCGSLYNHSYTPNADWTCRRRSQTIRLYATRTIQLGEEILINYSGAGGPGQDDIEFEVLT
jgi:SET domain-containing protein